MNKKKNKNKSNKHLRIYYVLLLLLLSSLISQLIFPKNPVKEITYNEFLSELDDGNIESVVVNDDTIVAKSHENDGVITEYKTKVFTDFDLVNRLIESDVAFTSKTSSTNYVIQLISAILPLIMIYIIYKKMIPGKSESMATKKKEYVPGNNSIKFADVAGEEESKESLVEIVDFLHNPKKYAAIGARLPKGALLVGPPGTGKTLLAKAVAGEAGVPFYSATGSDFVQMFVGVGAARVRELFAEAKKHAPCIIFIDEIDAIGRKRDSRGGSDERENTLNQLLSEMDGFDASKGIIVLGATNRPEILDAALLRPGRFDRQVIVGKPDLQGRIDILKVHAAKVKLSDNVDFHELALNTAGVSGADLANMVNEAAILAVKRNNEVIHQEDFLMAIEIVLVGKEKKNQVLSQEEKEIVAYHEIGHALVAAVQKNTEPVQKITIIPRTMGALGFVMQTPEKEKYLQTKVELEEMLVTTLAGRASEEVFFHTVTTGAANDIEKATKIARSMIAQYGMSDELGLVGFVDHDNPYLSNSSSLNCSPGMAEKIDHEVIDLIKKSYEKAKEIIEEHKDEMIRLSQYLIEHETITGKEFINLIKEKELS
jgi:cell division protease FtsH